MKRFVVFLSVILTLVLVSSVFAEQVQISPVSNDISVNVLESNDSHILVEYRMGSFTKNAVDINGKTYYRLSCGREGVMSNKGEPALPFINRSVIIPDDAKMEVKVISSEYRDFEGVPVAPSKGTLVRTVNPDDIPYTFGPVYNSDEWYSGKLASLGSPYILRDYRGVVVNLNAFQYNPKSQTLRVYTSVTLELVNVGPGQVNVLKRNKPFTSIVPDFEDIYQRRFINYKFSSTLYTPVEESGELLIITYDGFYNDMVPFMEWKLQKGIPTTMVEVSTIGNNANSIKNYIQNFYDNSDLAWVLLVGDAAQVATPIAHGGAADPTYAKVAGSDDYPDIFVGRFSAQNNSQVLTQVQRTVDYEKLPQSGNWFHMGTGIASDQGPGHHGEYDYQHMGLIRDDLLAYTYTSVDEIYDPGASASQVTAALNNGRSIVNYCGHGSMTSWGTTGFSNSNVNNLDNANMLPFIISVACNNGEFNDGTCFGEAWLRATNGSGEPTGAIGAYMSSISQYWDEPMDAQDEAVDLLVADEMHTFGGICFNGSCLMIDINGQTGVDMFDTWHIFGDPSILLRTDTPQSMTVVHQGAILFGQTYYDVQVIGVPGALCALYYDGTLYGSAYTDNNGNATIPVVGDLPIGGDLDLTVTAFNKATDIESVSVITSGYGAIGGRLTDMVSGEGLEGTVTVTDHDPEIVGHCNEEGYYIIYVPADTVWHLRAEYTSDYLPSFADLSVSEGDTLEYDFALEPKVAVVLKASFGNPSDIGYRTFYCRGSWDADGFYDAGWDAPFTPMRDDGVAPDEMAGDGIFTGVVLLATDLSHTYSWAVYSEDYNDEASRLQDGADFDVSDPGTPPDVPVLEVNPSGSEHNWTLTLFNTESGLSVDMLPGYGGLPYVWYATVNVPPGYETTHCLVKAMHSEVSTYGDGGVGGSPIELTFPEPGNYTVYFNDDNDITTTGASLIAQPNWLEVELTPGSSTTRELVLRNEGGLDLNFTIPDDFGDKVVMGGAPAPDPGPFTRYRYTGPKTASVDEFVGTPVVMGSGGPDDYGYKWMDSDEPGGPTYNWVEISGTGTPLNMGDDDNMGPYSLPFTFNYYGNNYSAFRVCSNGWISFTSTSTSYWNEEIPSSDAPGNMIAPMWDDMNPSAGGQVYYYISSDTAIVEWSGVPHYYDDGSYTYEVILTSGNAIFFQYQNLSGDVNSATVGIQNGDGSDGLQVVYNAAYLHDELAVRIAAGWLDVSPLSGVIPAGGQVDLTVVFDAGALLVGDYSGTITVQSWDEIQSLPDMLIPVSLHVEDVVPTIDLAMHPDDEPVVVPAGGSFDYTISVSNTTGGSLNYDGWLMLTLPDGSDYGPLAEISTSISGGETEYYFLTQDIPSFAPLGDYNYRAYVGDYPSAVIDGASFPFTVVSGAGSADGWDVIGFDPSILRGGVETALPRSYTLSQNYPNPFNAESVIEYGLPSGGDVELVVFNLLGQRVETLVNGYRQAGYHSVIWDASHYSSGIYFYKLTANGKTLTKRMTLLK